MRERIPAFSLPFGAANASYTREEEFERRDTLWREVRALMPAVDQLSSSYLVDRIGIKDGRHELYFDLEFTGQLPFPDGRARTESVGSLLERDLETLHRSIAAQQKEIFLEAHRNTAGWPARAGHRTTDRDIARWALMRRYRGQCLSIEFADGPQNIQFPEFPTFICDGETRLISAHVERVEAIAVRLYGIRYEGNADPSAARLGSRRQRFAILPAGSKCLPAGLFCAHAVLTHTRIRLHVKTALDFLTERISHFEIEEVENGEEFTPE